MTHLGKVAVAVLEGKVKSIIGDEAIRELKKPVVEEELKQNIAAATEYAEKRWVAEYEDRDVVAVVEQLSLHDLPSVHAALRTFFDHPADPIVVEMFKRQFKSILPKNFSEERLEAAVASYTDLLRTELIGVEGLREKLNALASITTARNTAQAADELKALNHLFAQLLSNDVTVPTLYDILPKDAAGEAEFARIVDLLLFHQARRSGRRTHLPATTTDYRGLSFFDTKSLRVYGTTVYFYQFAPSPFTDQQRAEIIDTLRQLKEGDLDPNSNKSRKRSTNRKGSTNRERILERSNQNREYLKVDTFILITPQDLSTVYHHQSTSDADWFIQLKNEMSLTFNIEHWGHVKILSLFKQTPSLCLYYHPQISDNGGQRRTTIQDTTCRYIDNIISLYRNIDFVGMSVYKPEATQGVPMEHIYIPLTVIPTAAGEQETDVSRTNPLDFLTPGARHVILGDPGSGKSTLLRFLGLVGSSEPLQKRYDANSDTRLPVIVILRRYADELKSRVNLSIIDYILENIQADFSLESADLDFLEYYLETGQAILLFDGLDEVSGEHLKEVIRNRIVSITTTYPGNTTIITSRIVGYDNPFRFSDKEFGHYRVAKLQIREMERFVNDWYAARIENKQEREMNSRDLVRILRSDDHIAIRELAENPLLLTIIALVHRIDAVLPDERVVLYQKCTETLLNTWYTWKVRGSEVKNKGKVERRNRRRLEAIANWMQQNIAGNGAGKRSIVSFDELRGFLTDHIIEVEKLNDPDNDPEDLAADFLDFVKKRTGLLIEVGDKQYSFVHLTFQEYLTSSHIITVSERAGVEGIWATLEPRYDDASWHEVIRLLIAGLRSDEAQEWLIEKILAEKEAELHVNRDLLLGGLLIDRVEAAELYQHEILQTLFRAAAAVSDRDQLRRISAMLRSWQSKEDHKEESLERAFHASWRNSTELQKDGLILVAYGLEWSTSKLKDILQRDIIGEHPDSPKFKLFFEQTLRAEDYIPLEPQMQLLWALQDYMSLDSMYFNFMAAVEQAVTLALDSSIASRRLFLEQLALFAEYPGPFAHFLRYTVQIASSDPSFSDDKLARMSLQSMRGENKVMPLLETLEQARLTAEQDMNVTPEARTEEIRLVNGMSNRAEKRVRDQIRYSRVESREGLLQFVEHRKTLAHQGRGGPVMIETDEHTRRLVTLNVPDELFRLQASRDQRGIWKNVLAACRREALS